MATQTMSPDGRDVPQVQIEEPGVTVVTAYVTLNKTDKWEVFIKFDNGSAVELRAEATVVLFEHLYKLLQGGVATSSMGTLPRASGMVH